MPFGWDLPALEVEYRQFMARYAAELPPGFTPVGAHPATDRVHHTGAREVYIAMTQARGETQVCQPARRGSRGLSRNAWPK